MLTAYCCRCNVAVHWRCLLRCVCVLQCRLGNTVPGTLETSECRACLSLGHSW